MPIPSVSIILPVYNARSFVGQALQSILSQDFQNFECVAIDDGSSDGSADILTDFASRDSRIHVFRRPNRGLVTTLNEACVLARGTWLARMDADDIALPDRLHHQMEFVNSHPSVIAVGGAIRYLTSSGLSDVVVRNPSSPKQLRHLLPRQNCFAHPTMLMRRDKVLAVGGYRSAFLHAEDYDLWLRLLDLGDLANLSHVLLHYRIHSCQVTYRNVEQQCMGTLAARIAYRRRKMGLGDISSNNPVDGPLLRQWGISESQIECEILLHYISLISLLSAIGEQDQADIVSRELQNKGSNRFSRLASAAYNLSQARRHLQRKRFAWTAVYAAKAALASPHMFFRYVRRRFVPAT